MKRILLLFILVVANILVAQNQISINGRDYIKQIGKWHIKDVKTDMLFTLNERSMTVKLKENKPRAALNALNMAHGVVIENENILGIIDLLLPENSLFNTKLNAYLNSGLFEFVEMNSYGFFQAEPDDPLFYQQYHFYNNLGWPHINATAAWDIETGSSNPVIVAVLDEGVDYDHDDLNIRADLGWDFKDNDNLPQPRPIDSHGTGVAGVFGAITNNTNCVAGLSGGWGEEYGSQIMAVRVGDGTELISVWSARLDDAIIYAAQNGASVINMSLVSDETYAIKSAIDYAQRHYNCVFVAAAGNSPNQTQVVFPARYYRVIAVGGITKNWNHYGNKGADLEIVAPAENIYTTTNYIDGICYDNFTGTSFAAPQVSGTAALLLSKNQNLLHSDVRNILKSSAVYEQNMVYDPLKFGNGLLKVDRALNALLPGYFIIPDYPQNLSVSNTPETNPILSWSLPLPEKTDRLVSGHFNIYRSVDISRYDFVKIGEVQQSMQQNYQWTDQSVEIPEYGAPYFFYRVTYSVNDKESISSNEVSVDANILWKTPSTKISDFDYNLLQNYPNPFNPVTKISYSIKETGNVLMELYDILGNKTKTLVNEVKEPGLHSVKLDASDLSSGLYFYKLQVNDFISVKKTILLK
jgi:subtilisin family serine protease